MQSWQIRCCPGFDGLLKSGDEVAPALAARVQLKVISLVFGWCAYWPTKCHSYEEGQGTEGHH